MAPSCLQSKMGISGLGFKAPQSRALRTLPAPPLRFAPSPCNRYVTFQVLGTKHFTSFDSFNPHRSPSKYKHYDSHSLRFKDEDTGTQSAKGRACVHAAAKWRGWALNPGGPASGPRAPPLLGFLSVCPGLSPSFTRDKAAAHSHAAFPDGSQAG